MKRNQGFTLIELLVVVLIIGILSAIALPQYFKAVEKARGSEALSLFGSVIGAEQRYYLTRDHYTSQFGLLDLDLTDETGAQVSGTKTSFTTKNFTISILNAGTGNNANVQAVRRQGRYVYTLCKNFNTGEIKCGGASNRETQAICPTLGDFTVENEPDCTGNNY